MTLPVIGMPLKPVAGEPCNGCGHCCAEEVCLIGRMLFDDTPAPCPALVSDGRRYWCGVASQMEGVNAPMNPAMFATIMGFGFGCDSSPKDG